MSLKKIFLFTFLLSSFFINNINAQLLNISKAPEFELKNTENKSVKLSDFKNKIVILDFWATWCPPCIKGIPDLVSLQSEYKNEIVVIGISVDTETKDKVVPFMKEFKINYPVVYFNEKIIKDYGGITGIPTTFIIDRKGYIQQKYVGLVEKEVLKSQIKKLL